MNTLHPSAGTATQTQTDRPQPHDDGAHQPTPPVLLVTVATAAAMCAISRSACYEHIREGRFPGVVTLGSRIRISVRALEAWITARAAEAADDER